MKLTLRNKILILLILISILPLGLFAALGGYLINFAQKHNIFQLEEQLLSQKEKEIEKFFVELFNVQVATPVAALSIVPHDQRESLLKEIALADKSIDSIAFLEYDFLYPDKPENGMELNKLVKGTPVVELLNQKNTPYFRKTAKGENYFGPVYQKGDDYFMAAASPIKNKDGVIIGVAAGEISLKQISALIRNSVLGNSGYLLLTDHRGVIWAKPQRLNEQGFGSNVFILSVLGGWQGGNFGELHEYQSTFGETVVAGGRKLKNLDWVIAAEWPKDDAYTLIYSVSRQAFLFLLIILGIVIAAAFLFAARIIKPIRTLEEGAKTLGQGNLDHRINVRTQDELEDLAFRFNEMARNLKEVEKLRETKARMEGLAKSLAKEKELSQIKDKFIATASHQLRTPISVIRWVSETLRKSAAESDVKEFSSQLEDLYKNIDALSLVVGDILTIAELGIGYAPTAVFKFSLKNEVNEMIDKFKRGNEKNISVKLMTDNEKDEYNVSASILNIRRALEQLFNNAFTYTKENGNILLELKRMDGEIEFSIKDDGIGIPKEDQKFIFGEFFRGKNSIEMKNVGTGLGLFIVKTIIEGHKGRFGFESPTEWQRGSKKIQAGARFYFSL